MTNNLEKRILDKIKKDKIKPKSKLYFILKNSFFMSVFGISILLGSIAFSVLFYILSDNFNILNSYFDIYQLKNAILFWLALLIIFGYISIKNSQNIKNSYKYPASILILFNIFASVILGLIFYYTGVAKKTDELSSKHLDFYQKNIRITEIKKEIFLKKLKEIGITKDVLKKYPELKNKIENKFNEKVLGKIYLIFENNCKKDDFVCSKNEINFKDNKGCGCKTIYK